MIGNAPRTQARLFELYRRTRDPDLFRRVYDSSAPELLRVALYHAGNLVDAEELVQRTFFVAIQKAEQFDSDQSWIHWLLGILNLEARRLRRETARPPGQDRLAGRAVTDPAVDAELAEMRRVIDEAMARCPKTYREVLELQMSQGLSPSSIAERLGRPASTIRTQLARGYEHLRRILPAGLASSAVVGGMLADRLAAIRAHLLRELPGPGTAGLTVVGFGSRVGRLGVVGLLLGALALLAQVLLSSPDTFRGRPADESAQVAGTVPSETARGAPSRGAEEREAQPAASGPGTRATKIRIVRSLDGQITPVPGAAVGFCARWSPDRPDPWSRLGTRAFVTDSDGMVDLGEVPVGMGALVFGSESLGSAAIRKLEIGREGLITIEARNVERVAGRVLGPDSEAISGATVWMHFGTGEMPWQRIALTGDDGEFEVSVLNDVYFVLSASAPGYIDSQKIERLPGSKVPAATMVLQPNPATVGGRVLDPRGGTVSSAFVRVWSIADFGNVRPGEGWVDGDGGFRFGGYVDGPGCVVVLTADGRGAMYPFEVPNEHIEVVLSGPSATLFGSMEIGSAANDRHWVITRPIHPLGVRRPGVGALLARVVRVSADGSYELDRIPPVRSRFYCWGGGGEVVGSDIGSFYPGERRRWDPVDRSFEVRGRVVDERDQAVAGVRVGLLTEFARRFHAKGSFAIREVVTDSQGGFEFRTSLRGDLTLAVLKSRNPTRPQELLPVAAVPVIPNHEHRLPIRRSDFDPLVLRGCVVGPDGRPRARCGVQIQPSGLPPHGWCIEAQTNAEGRFSVGGLVRGAYRVRLIDRVCGVLHRGNIDLRDDVDLGTVRLRRPRPVRFSVRSKVDGKPVPAQFWLTDRDGAWIAWSGEKEKVSWLPRPGPAPGSYVLKIFGRELAPVSLPVVIEAGRGKPVDLEIEGAPSVRCRFVVDKVFETHDPQTNEFMVMQILRGGVEVTPPLTLTQTMQETYERVQGLELGEYELQAHFNTGASLRKTFVVEAKGTTEFRFVMR